MCRINTENGRPYLRMCAMTGQAGRLIYPVAGEGLEWLKELKGGKGHVYRSDVIRFLTERVARAEPRPFLDLGVCAASEICGWCGKLYPVNGQQRGPPRKYCTERCRKGASRERCRKRRPDGVQGI